MIDPDSIPFLNIRTYFLFPLFGGGLPEKKRREKFSKYTGKNFIIKNYFLGMRESHGVCCTSAFFLKTKAINFKSCLKILEYGVMFYFEVLFTAVQLARVHFRYLPTK